MLRSQGRHLAQHLKRYAQASHNVALSTSGAGTSEAASTAAASQRARPPVLPTPKTAEQLTPEELSQSLPSMLFTTRNLVLSTLLASAVAGVGLFSMFWVGTLITNAAASLKHTPEPAALAPPPKTLGQLIAERKAELEEELTYLQQLPRDKQVKQRIAELRGELRQVSPQPWYRWW